MNCTAIVQARMNSSRFPGKVLEDIAGKPMLERVVDRASRANRIDRLLVATTDSPADDVIEKLCIDRNWLFYRGNENDVLDRYYQAAKREKAETIVRITADCPIIDPGLIDETVCFFDTRQVDYAANRLPPPWRRTYPMGLDVEVCSFDALRRTWKEADTDYQRMHVMPYMYEKDRGFSVAVMEYTEDCGAYRLAVDTPEDMDLIRRIYTYYNNASFTWLDAVHLLEEHPEWTRINRHVQQKEHGVV